MSFAQRACCIRVSGALLMVILLFRSSVALTVVSPPELAGVVLRAPILEINAFQVIRANLGTWGRTGRLALAPDRSGCRAPPADWNSDSVALLMDGGGCSVEDKARAWQGRTLAVILVVRFQWVSDLVPLMYDHSDMWNVTTPLLCLKYGTSWREPLPRVDWGLRLWDMTAAGQDVVVQIDFPDRQEIYWDLRTGRAALSAFLNYTMLFWSVIILCITWTKLTVMFERSGLKLNVPNMIFVLDFVSAFFILLASIFGPYFSTGFYISEAALFFQTFYLPWVLSANTLLSFYWLELTFFVAKSGAQIHRLFWPTVVNCIMLFALDVTRDILLAVNAEPIASYYLSVIGYSVLGPYQLILLLFAIFRLLTKIRSSQTALAKSAPQVAFWMFCAAGSGIIMLGGLIVYAVFEFQRWMTTMFFNIFLLQGGALFLMTAHNGLFQMRTQKQIVELGAVILENIPANTSLRNEEKNNNNDEVNNDEVNNDEANNDEA